MVDHGFTRKDDLPQLWQEFTLLKQDPARVAGILLAHVAEQCYCGPDPQVVGGPMRCHHCELITALTTRKRFEF